MGCFPGCFGSKKERRRQRKRASPTKRVLPRDQENVCDESLELEPSTICLNKDCIEKPNVELSDKLEEQLNINTRKKVTFAVNVQTYEETSTQEIVNEGSEDEKGKEHSRLNSLSPDDSKFFPSNHRYENCSNSDDEYEAESEGSDLEDDEDDYYDYEDEDEHKQTVVSESSESFFSLPSAVQKRGSESPLAEKEVNSPQPKEQNSTRDRVNHSVLNPIENLTQWKAVKMGSKPPLKQQKEKTDAVKGVQIPFSLEPNFKFSTFSSPSKMDHSGSLKDDITVDTSLSNWLGSSESTPSTKTCNFSFGTESVHKSPRSSPRSNEDRPILGALTVEEIRQFSANSSPRKSPSRSPDDMPILGTVGSYWSHTGQTTNSSSNSSTYKGIPNTTSKYREDKLVSWHTTPFEKRLERALDKGEPEAYSC
ncbi:hypothetical protein ACHQM5_014183 [Ranunculus cassubicifolius]